MRWRRAGCALAALAAVGAVAAGWLTEVPDITAADAVAVAEGAFADAGVDARVEADPTATRYASRSQELVDVWAVRATVRSAAVDLLLARGGARPVSIDDRSPNGSEYVLSEAEFDAVAAGVDDPALRRLVRRNVVLTIAAACVVAAALAIALTSAPREPR